MSTASLIVLFLFQILTVASAIIVAFHPNILYASIALLFSFIGVAIMFLFAGADFLAGAQVIVYVGGVTILVLFAIMLTQWMYQLKLRDIRTKMLIPLAVVGLAVVPFLYKALHELSQSVLAAPPEKLAEFAALPKTNLIGNALLTTYILPFEAITVLLLGALVGAVWIARPK